ncbi:acetyltransferase [Ligilactobacillus apodemi]|uniref:Acetyltransferase n=1 Tax=Ligilactobacillus apodemi DSM 16634 = JCM 16172 TaxID=1423724 RepID=A0A0R1TUG7_9LACO|nr:acetyltransferase [Ligilactobacillus apodemi]KRL84861.1 acetyltransferase [Ligilactobacillus apodemi DSM 16634 = JCM 16172]
MPVRLATTADLPEILAIYQYARTQMIKNNNPTQWKKTHPTKEVILADIAAQDLYVIYDDETIGGIFAFITGEDPTYQHIEGQWLNADPYGTIHRIAGNGKVPHIFEQALAFCAQLEPNIKIDTHQDNTIMRHLITKNGFEYCGIIQTDDGTDRLAYQKRC